MILITDYRFSVTTLAAMFVNRERELEALESRYGSDQAELVVVTGRRRMVGPADMV